VTSPSTLIHLFRIDTVGPMKNSSNSNFSTETANLGAFILQNF
jgi:hypothetical protein